MKSLLRTLISPSSSNGRFVLTAIALLTIAAYAVMLINSLFWRFQGSDLTLLTDPFLQLPTADAVRVVWFTEFAGDRHQVEYGENLEYNVEATTTQLSRVREDQKSRVGEQTEPGQLYLKPTQRSIWRHEAIVNDLSPGMRVPYRVVSTETDGRQAVSNLFTLSAAPASGQSLKVLLTSDHQLMPMTAANLQKVIETVGQVDAVFMAGDLVNVPDRASEWFDDNRGGAFFPALQGRAHYALEREGKVTVYQGGAIAQQTPLFTAIGNHEVMGRFSMTTELGEQFNDPIPKSVAAQRYALNATQINPTNDPDIRESWLKDHSFNTDTYEEIFSLPESSPGGKTYYAVSFGDIRLVVLFATNIWRVPSLGPDAKGRYRERDADLEAPEKWGYGQHIFEPIFADSPQYNWLKQELNSPAFQQARYKIVMFHHPPHSLGDNIVPAYTAPVQLIDQDDSGQIQSIRYEYPIAEDYLIRDVVPLLENAGVHLVFYGHSHLWNRFISPNGMHFLESSNVGNTYGAYVGRKRRQIPIGFEQKYVPQSDPNGLEPIVPTLAPLLDAAGHPQPYISSDDITVFSILDTNTGTVTSYYFDTRKPESQVIAFDAFELKQ